MKFILVSFKKNIIPFILVLLIIVFVIFSKSNLIAAKQGLVLWANNVVPALLPFFILTELISHTNIVYYLGKILDKIMRPLFNVPGAGAFPFIMGLISGYPVGGKIVADMRKQKICSKDEGDRLLAFTNNSGPLFIVSSVGVSLFGDTKTGLLLLCTHILASISVGIILGKLSTTKCTKADILSTKQSGNLIKQNLNFRDFGGILGESINHAISTTLMIGGFVVIFSVIISLLEKTNLLDIFSKMLTPILQLFNFDTTFSKPILSGIIELTNGVSMISSISIKSMSQNVILCAFLLGFGGISVLLQILSLLSKTDLSIFKYVIGKFLQGILAALYTFIALKLFPFLTLDIVPTCAQIVDTIIYPISFFGIHPYIILPLVLLLIIFLAFSRPCKKKCHSKKC